MLAKQLSKDSIASSTVEHNAVAVCLWSDRNLKAAT